MRELARVSQGRCVLFGEWALGVLRNRGTRMTERDAEREWGGQQANLGFFRLARGLHSAISVSVPGWGREPLDQLALTLGPLMPPPLLTSGQLHPHPTGGCQVLQ